jgi:uncharacterized protein YecT (DUF1311 family)
LGGVYRFRVAATSPGESIMKSRAFAVALLIAVLSAVALGSQSTSPVQKQTPDVRVDEPSLRYSSALDDCYSEPGGLNQTTAGMRFCVEAELSRWQKRLDTAYQSALKEYADDDREHPRNDKEAIYSTKPKNAKRVQFLRKAQEAWVAFVNADCTARLLPVEGGTIMGEHEAGCRLDHTIVRTLDLEHLVSPTWCPPWAFACR